MTTRKKRAEATDELEADPAHDTSATSSSTPASDQSFTQPTPHRLSALIMAAQTRPTSLDFSPSTSSSSSSSVSVPAPLPAQIVNRDRPSVSARARSRPPLIPVADILGRYTIPAWPVNGGSTYWSSLRAEEQRVGLRLFLENANYHKVKPTMADSGDKYNTRMKRAQVAMEERVGNKYSRQWMGSVLYFWQTLPDVTKATLVQRCKEFVRYDNNDRALLKIVGASEMESDDDTEDEEERSAEQVKHKRKKAANGTASDKRKKARTSSAEAAPVPRNASSVIPVQAQRMSSPTDPAQVPQQEHDGHNGPSAGHVRFSDSSASLERAPKTELPAQSHRQPVSSSHAASSSSSSSASHSRRADGAASVRSSSERGGAAAASSGSASSGRLGEALHARLERMTATHYRVVTARQRSAARATELLTVATQLRSLVEQIARDQASCSSDEVSWHEQGTELHQYAAQLETAERKADELKRELDRRAEEIARREKRVEQRTEALQHERKALEQEQARHAAYVESRKTMMREMMQDGLADVVRLKDKVAELESRLRMSGGSVTDGAAARRATVGHAAGEQGAGQSPTAPASPSTAPRSSTVSPAASARPLSTPAMPSAAPAPPRPSSTVPPAPPRPVPMYPSTTMHY